MKRMLIVLAACSAPHASVAPDASAPASPDANDLAPHASGLVAAGFAAGVFAPGVASDPAIDALEAATGRPLGILQTYRSLAEPAAITTDLAAIFARGAVAHLNVEPAGYTHAQYADPTSLAPELAAMGDAVAAALAPSDGRVILTFGAEMNGNWTDWGCLPAAQFIALYRAAHDAVATALAARSIDPRRVRWAYGPNATSSANCGSAAGYYPGHAYVDLLGLSAYRSGSQTVEQAVGTPIDDLFDALAYPAAWRARRFVLLQTGSRAATDRDAWTAHLYASLAADPRVAGAIWFDDADWAAPAATLAPPIAATPAGTLDGIFAPSFRDVPYDHPAFAEIQALHDHAITNGCDAFDFCPDDAITAADAMALLARAGVSAQLADPVLESDLAAALGLNADPVQATRARAAVLIAQGTSL